MPPISTKTHAAGDYATGLLMLAAPKLLSIRDRPARATVVGAGAGILVASAFTDYELGLRRRLPMPTHLMLDAATGALMLAGSRLLRRRRGARTPDWLPAAAVGIGELAGAVLTERQPADRAGREQGTGTADVQAAGAGEAPAARDTGVGAGAPVAPAPTETPGPSVTPPQQPESEVERAERIDANLAGAGAPQTGETLVAQQEEAAAAEAAAIGGAVPSDDPDPAMDPVYQAGGGEEEGWEAAEADLVENATHGDGHGQPERDAFTPEAESDHSTAVYGEADWLPSTEVLEDPQTGEDDPGAGPGLTAERGPSTDAKQE